MRERENEFDPCQVQVLKYKKRLRNLGFFRGVELSMATTDARRGASCLRFSCRRMRLEPGNQGMKTQNSSSSTCDSKPLDYLASFLNFSACNIAAGGNVMYFLQEMERACDTGKDEWGFLGVWSPFKKAFCLTSSVANRRDYRMSFGCLKQQEDRAENCGSSPSRRIPSRSFCDARKWDSFIFRMVLENWQWARIESDTQVWADKGKVCKATDLGSRK